MDSQQMAQTFLVSREAKQLSPHTTKWYRIILGRFCCGHPELPMDPASIDLFLAGCPGQDERRHGYYRALRVFYRFLSRRGLVAINPMDSVEAPRVRRKLPHVLSQDELQRLLSYPHAHAMYALLTLLADTGARIGEAARIRQEDLQILTGYHCLRLSGKTGPRIVPLSDRTYHLLLEALPFRSNADELSRDVSAAFRDAGVQGTAHTLRHTFATLWEGSEFALKGITGHSSFEMLARYRQMRIAYLAKEHQEFSPLRRVAQLKLEGV